MRKVVSVLMMLCVLWSQGARGQGLHFSQFANAPLLLNAANTALLPDNDYRIGINYRTQWASVPVPFNTFSLFADCKVGGNNNNVRHNNWLGVGVALFSDKAGDGNLALTHIQGNLAYHVRLSEFTMLSMGMSGAYAQRSVNYDNLTFDAQWDGFSLNKALPNGEKVGILKTNYYTIGAGLNFAWFPNDGLYSKLGLGVTNVNKPIETFYGATNTLDYRPTATLEVTGRLSPRFISTFYAYYTTQTGAYEMIVGELERILLSDNRRAPVELLLGCSFRYADALIPMAGIQINRWQFLANYDFTMSQLAPYNKGRGAFELSLIYQGPYHPNDGVTSAFSCPRFF